MCIRDSCKAVQGLCLVSRLLGLFLPEKLKAADSHREHKDAGEFTGTIGMLENWGRNANFPGPCRCALERSGQVGTFNMGYFRRPDLFVSQIVWASMKISAVGEILAHGLRADGRIIVGNCHDGAGRIEGKEARKSRLQAFLLIRPQVEL